MINPQQYLREHIMKMSPYTPIVPFEVLSEQLGISAERITKLDANENPYGPIPAVEEALSNLRYTHIYPDPESRKLRHAIANTLKIPFENIIAGAGADELIDLTMRLLIDPGDHILNCPPTFGMYQFDADVNAARVINIARNERFELDVENIAAAVEMYQPKLLFLASPNNPDGGLLPWNILEKILGFGLIVVLDEAYVDFADQNLSLVSEVIGRENLIVLRTFSKWPGLAGLRVGYGVYPEWMMPHLWKIKQPYNVSVAASLAATVSLENIGQLETRTQLIVSERERLFERLKTLTWISPYRSQANFILCQIKEHSAAAIKAQLASKGILVRYFNKPGLTDHIRISVGKPEHTQHLMKVLESF